MRPYTIRINDELREKIAKNFLKNQDKYVSPNQMVRAFIIRGLRQDGTINENETC